MVPRKIGVVVGRGGPRGGTSPYGRPEIDELVFSFVCRDVGGELTTTDEAGQVEYVAADRIPANTLPRHLERIRDALEERSGLGFKLQRSAAAPRQSSEATCPRRASPWRGCGRRLPRP